MRIHLADNSGDRGQYKLLADCLFQNHLISYAYLNAYPYFERLWNALVRIHLVAKPSSNSGLQVKALLDSGLQNHLLSYAFQNEEGFYSPVWESEYAMHVHLTTCAGVQWPYQTLAEVGQLNHLTSFAYPGATERFEKVWQGNEEAMKVYLAGYSARTDIQAQIRPQHDAHLVTHDQPKQAEETTQICATDFRPRVIVDSGAFTAWSTGKVVRPQDYAEWALGFDAKWRSKMSSLRYINLDYIPGTKGVSATAEQLLEATEKSMRNADFLRASGLSPVIEVFHQDEPFELLKRLEDRRQGGCIALSPRNDVSVKKRSEWLQRVLHYCVKTFGKDRIPPAHGLAVTTEQLLKVFPFYSADSSTWISCLRFGHGKTAGFDRLPRYKTSDGAMAATLHTLRAEIRKYQKMEQDMTNLWKIRGVTWNESEIR